MPRKPTDYKPIKIEGLTEVARPSPGIAPDHRKLVEEANARAKDESLSMLVRLGIEKHRPDPIPRPQVELIPKGMRKIAEINGLAVLVPMKPWRRM